MSNKNPSNVLFSFSIGPVQDFISGARTVRDLWSGSYILSWLTARAIAEVVKEPLNGKVMHLREPKKHPLVELVMEHKIPENGESEYLIPCLPNRFLAEIEINNNDREEKIKRLDGIENTVANEWKKIANKVHENLNSFWNNLPRDKDSILHDCGAWDISWDKQIKNFWAIRTAWIDITDKNIEKARQFSGKFQDYASEQLGFKAAKLLLEQLNIANKMVRHYPPHENEGVQEEQEGKKNDNSAEPKETRPKCCLCGKFSQMGPIITNCNDNGKITQMGLSKDFWHVAAKKSQEIGWERIQTKDRFCAIHLVKRFAWRFYFSNENGRKMEIGKKRVPDTSTIAAMSWMDRLREKPGAPLLYEKAENTLMNEDKKNPHWTGHWLHWKTRDELADETGDEPKCPEHIWNELILKSRDAAASKGLPRFPPSYYAIIKLDGDKMGDRFKKSTREQFLSLGSNLSRFALENVQGIVERDHLGYLVYSGGDDVLALVPMENALSCAKEIHDRLMALSIDETPVTSSAGIVVSHYKFPLLDAMEEAEKAEKMAKNSGRNCMALKIIRHSGIQTTSVIPWKCVDYMENFIRDFQNGVTDRWSYHAVAEWKLINPGLSEDGKSDPETDGINVCKIMDSEVMRLIRRSDMDEQIMKNMITRWNKITRFLEFEIPQGKKKNATNPKILAIDNALNLIQSASFLARGREE